MKTYEHHPKVLTNNKFYVIMLEYPWFKQSKGLLPKNGHPSVIPLFMEILKLGVHIPIGLMIICNSEWNNLKANLPVSWSIWHHMAFLGSPASWMQQKMHRYWTWGFVKPIRSIELWVSRDGRWLPWTFCQVKEKNPREDHPTSIWRSIMLLHFLGRFSITCKKTSMGPRGEGRSHSLPFLSSPIHFCQIIPACE